MKDKNLQTDNNTQSLEELTKEACNIIESLEGERDLQNSIDSYQKLLKLNNIIEKKFNKTTKIINEDTKKKINNINLKKNDIILFGRESAGVPEVLHQSIKNRLKIPINKKTRSLNVAMSVAIVASEALRQNNL